MGFFSFTLPVVVLPIWALLTGIVYRFILVGYLVDLKMVTKHGFSPRASPYGLNVNAHRAGPRERTEMTLGSFQEIWMGTNVSLVECDVLLTKDKKVVVLHDLDLQRLTGENLQISQINYDEIPQLQDKYSIDFHPNLTYTVRAEEDGKVPLLDTLFEVIPDLKLSLEFRDGDIETRDLALDLIDKHQR